MKKLSTIIVTILAICSLLIAFSVTASAEVQPPAIAAVGISYEAGDTMYMYFKLFIGENAAADQKYGMIFWTEEQAAGGYIYDNVTAENAEVYDQTEAVAETFKGHPVKVFKYTINLWEMADVVYAQGYMIDSNGDYTYSSVIPYSFVTYVRNKIGINETNASNVLVTDVFLKKMQAYLDLGTVYQEEKAHNLDNKANEVVEWCNDIQYISNGDGTCYVSRSPNRAGCYIRSKVIGGECNGMIVVGIGDSAFINDAKVESITLPETIETIGDDAFKNCTGLQEFKFNGSEEAWDNVQKGDDWAHNAGPDGGDHGGGGDIKITIIIVFPAKQYSEGLKYTSNNDGTCSVSIGTCTDTEVYIPKVAPDGDCAGMKVTGIRDYAFTHCSLTSVTIPNSVTSIGRSAFNSCAALKSITIPNSVTHIGACAFSYCHSLTNVMIPNSVTSIGYSTFSCCTGLTRITVAKNNSVYHSAGNCIIETASKTLIAGCKSSVIPTDGSVTSIGGGAFSDCSGLKSVTIPEGVTSIGGGAFSGCNSLKSITIPDDVTSIGNSAFDGCFSLKSITIPNSVTHIDDYAFRNCRKLTNITIPKRVTSVGDYVFYGCTNLTNITIPEGVTSIGNNAFSDCSSLTSITIPNSVTSIDYNAFSGCSSLTSITIPDGVTSIGACAFSGCAGLTSITIPDSVMSIGPQAFVSTSYYNDISNWENGVLYIDNHLIEADRTSVSGSYNIKVGTKCIAADAFWDCIELTSITIPNSVTSIGGGAFGMCERLMSITIPSSVTNIGNSAFYWCTNLASITVDPGNPKYYSYGNCLIESATGTIIAGCKNSWIGSNKYSFTNVTSIGDYAFYWHTGLESINISVNVTSIGDYALANTGLTDIYYEGTESEWDAISKGYDWDYGITYTVHCGDYTYYWDLEENIIKLEYLKDDLTNGRQVTLNGTQYDSVTKLYNSFTGTVQDGKFIVAPKSGYEYELNTQRTQLYLAQLANVKDRVSAKISAINLLDYGISTGTTPADAYKAAVADIEKIIIQASNTASDGLPEATTLDDYSFPIAYQRYYTTLYDWTRVCFQSPQPAKLCKPQQCSRQINESEEPASELFEAHSDPAMIFDLHEKAFNKMSFFVVMEIGVPRIS